MSIILISLLIALSASAWIYSKLMRSTGGITKNALTAAGIAGSLIFVILLVITNLVL